MNHSLCCLTATERLTSMSWLTSLLHHIGVSVAMTYIQAILWHPVLLTCIMKLTQCHPGWEIYLCWVFSSLWHIVLYHMIIFHVLDYIIFETHNYPACFLDLLRWFSIHVMTNTLTIYSWNVAVRLPKPHIQCKPIETLFVILHTLDLHKCVSC